MSDGVMGMKVYEVWGCEVNSFAVVFDGPWSNRSSSSSSDDMNVNVNMKNMWRY
jgi:hypothetical protein